MNTNKLHRIAASALAALAALCLTAPISAAEPDYTAMLNRFNTLEAQAASYEDSGNLTFAYPTLAEYAALARTLADAGKIHPYTADLAEHWYNSLEFDPILYTTAERKLFLGSDSTAVGKNQNALRLNVQYDLGQLSDHYPTIPKTNEEQCILVALEITTEKLMRNIAFGKDDARLTAHLRDVAKLEGEIYLAFCPSVNTLPQTRTLAQSYTAAYRYVADAARRYAPNAKLVYALADVTTPGENTVAKFYPGDGYVDVFGVEITTTYSTADAPSAEAAYDRRGDYYDPVYSVQVMAEEFAALGGDCPVAVTSVSFPWEGKAAVTDWAAEMEHFYRTLPNVCPSLTAIFYSCRSNARGISNLRQNPEAASLYEELLSLPRTEGVPLTEAKFPANTPVTIGLYAHTKFRKAGIRVFVNGTEADPDAVVFAPGKNTLQVYMTHNNYPALFEYTVTAEGTITPATPAIDYDGNGRTDFSDVDLLTAKVAGWNVEITGNTDVNGDGKTNLLDATALRKLISRAP